VINKLKDKMKEYFVGKEEVVENVLVCLLAGGHILLEDVPGVGKTTLARTLAASINSDFGRIQFTPDTLPGDIIGTTVFNMKTQEFEYHKGAVMHQIILADEINRTSPKTQASLLEAMAEKQVTVDGKIYELPSLFMIIATQNPVEFLGTYALPEAQMDRFMMRLSIGYPDKNEEIRMAQNFLTGKVTEKIEGVCSVKDILDAQKKVSEIAVKESILDYMREMIDMTRHQEKLVLGASPRAFLNLVRASQARAYLNGRDYVKPDDVKAVIINVLHHRVSLTSEAKIQKEDIDTILRAIVFKAKVPME